MVYEHIVKSIAKFKAAHTNAQDVIDGWQIRYKVRPTGKHGDFIAVDPRDGQHLASMVAIRRKLGLPDEEASVTTSVRSPQVAHSTTPSVRQRVTEEVDGVTDTAKRRRKGTADDVHGVAKGVEEVFNAAGKGGSNEEYRNSDKERVQGRRDEGGRGKAAATTKRPSAAPPPGGSMAEVDSAQGCKGATAMARWSMGMVVEVLQTEEGLVGSRYSGVILQLRGRSCTQKEVLVRYDSLFDDWEDGEAGRQVADVEPRALEEWVRASQLVMPPPKTPADWLRSLRPGDEADTLHEGGWWHVVVQSKIGGKAKFGEPAHYVVEAVGYGVRRTVEGRELRPHAPG